MIPENIHTIPQAAFWNSKGGGSWTGILKAWGVTQFGIPNALGVFSSEFPEKEDGLEFGDLISFPVCKSSVNRPWIKSMWISEQISCAVRPTLKKP